MRIGFFLATEEFTPAELLYIHQIGGPGDDFFGRYAKEILAHFER